MDSSQLSEETMEALRELYLIIAMGDDFAAALDQFWQDHMGVASLLETTAIVPADFKAHLRLARDRVEAVRALCAPAQEPVKSENKQAETTGSGNTGHKRPYVRKVQKASR